MISSRIGYILYRQYENGDEEFAYDPCCDDDYFDTTDDPTNATVWKKYDQAKWAKEHNSHWGDFEIRYVRITTETTIIDIKEEENERKISR